MRGVRRWLKGLHRVVEFANHPADPAQFVEGERRQRVRQRTRDVLEDVPPPVVPPKGPGRERLVLQMGEHSLDSGRVRERRLLNRLPDPDDPVSDVPAGQLLLDIHAAIMSCRIYGGPAPTVPLR